MRIHRISPDYYDRDIITILRSMVYHRGAVSV